MSRTWKHAVQETVQQNRYVPLPAPIRSVVGTEHPLDGPSVYWHYDRSSNYVVLADHTLEEPTYVDVGRYKIYGADDADSRARIRPPDALDRVVRSQFTEQTRVVYLAYEEMTTAGIVYLLSTAQLLDVLPDGSAAARTVSDGGPQPLQEALLQLPGFLPAP
jgi:hypothetical protein